MKNCFQLQDKLYLNACRWSLYGQIRLYCKNMIASRTSRIVMKTYCQRQDKSYANEKLFSATGLFILPFYPVDAKSEFVKREPLLVDTD